jgi:hypothetical protein
MNQLLTDFALVCSQDLRNCTLFYVCSKRIEPLAPSDAHSSLQTKLCDTQL